MEPIAIVRKRSRVWPLVITLIVIALVVAAAMFFLGDGVNETVRAPQAPQVPGIGAVAASPMTAHAAAA
jgi:hypothetical protein